MLRTRINWDDYFMVQALWAKVRSPDASTQCGCILVDKRGRLIGQGYNGYPRNIDDSKMPQTRPEKYPPILHSEENAISNSTGDLEGATVYVTGPPCTHCWAHIIQKGIKRVVYGPITTSPQGLYTNAQLDGVNPVVENMLENQNIEVVRWIPNNHQLIQKELKLILQLIIMEEISEDIKDVSV
jgi:dCMP deaminase